MSFSKYNPFPRSFGSRQTKLAAIESSFKAGQGTALAMPSPYRDCKNHSIARGLWANAMDAERCSNVANVSKVTSNVLHRWEKILGLSRNRNQSDNLRRQALQIHQSLYGEPATIQRIVDIVTNVVGANVVVGVTPITQDESLANGCTSLPDGPVTPPGENVIPQGDFRSNVCCVSIQLTDTSVSSLQFWTLVSQIHYHLTDVLPAWIDWTYWVTDGFILDQQNLDYSQLNEDPLIIIIDPGAS